LFELLQTASGVGPRLAQAVLGVHSPDVVRRAIAGAALAPLTQVRGIGKKGAEKMVVELRDRIGPLPIGDGAPAGVLSGGWQEQGRQGGVALGWDVAQGAPAGGQGARGRARAG